MSRIVSKPWGHEEIWAEADQYVGKILYIRDGQRISLQHHEVKREHIRVLSGQMQLELEEAGALASRLLQPGDVAEIPPGRRHRMKAIGDVAILEVSTPELDDVVRHADDYGRV